MQLITTDPNHLEYPTATLHYTILGGIRLEGLDRMRVTLKIEVRDRQHEHYLQHPELANLALRHNLDLYNDTQVERLIRKAAERLEVGSTVLTQTIAKLTSELELYRLQEIKAQSNQGEQPRKILNEKERAAAESFLKAPALLKRTNERIGKSGVVGEATNRLLMYLVFTSRKCHQPLHVVSLGSSGSGKTHLQEKVGALIPQEDRIEITTLSENAFYYFGQRELTHRLILIEDLDGAESALYPLRELQSKKKISKTVAHKDARGNTRTVHLRVEGPVCVAGCTTRERLYEDNANRSFLLYLDESAEQDQQIMDYQRAKSAGLVDEKGEAHATELLQNCQRILRPITVRNPYAPYLQIPPEVFKPRRTNAHYLSFIEVVTYYHQYQREVKTDTATGEQYIETTKADIQAANQLLQHTLLRKSDELSGACRNYFERLKNWLGETSKTAFTNRQARTVLRTSPSTQKRYTGQLQACGLIRRATGGNRKQGFLFEIVSPKEYEHLQARIQNVLDDIFEKLPEPKQVAQGTQPDQTTDGPLHPLPVAQNTKWPSGSPQQASGSKTGGAA